MTQEITEPKIVKPFSYPIWVIGSTVVILVLFVYSLILLPRYIKSTKNLKIAQAYFDNGKYDASIECYTKVLDLVPYSKEAKIDEATAIFALNDPKYFDIAMGLLQGLYLNDTDMKRINSVLPENYRQYFK